MGKFVFSFTADEREQVIAMLVEVIDQYKMECIYFKNNGDPSLLPYYYEQVVSKVQKIVPGAEHAERGAVMARVRKVSERAIIAQKLAFYVRLDKPTQAKLAALKAESDKAPKTAFQKLKQQLEAKK